MTGVIDGPGKNPLTERLRRREVWKMICLPFAGYCRDGAGKQEYAHAHENGDQRLQPQPPGARFRIIGATREDYALPEPPDQDENESDPIAPCDPRTVIRKD
jgi:hypothetical protein